MERRLIEQLLAWKNSSFRKPLVLKGARQVGKTWILKHFGKSHYKELVYINFEERESLQSLFEQDFDISRILATLGVIHQKPISSEETLIVFDELQVAKRGITALKHFKENAPEYHVIAAGSLLGISLHQEESFPVGQVDFLELFPLSFEEFLINFEQSMLVELLRAQNWNVLNSFHEKLKDLLRQYYFLGGMPEVLSVFFQTRSYTQARIVQKAIINGYEQDFSKYAPNELVPKIRLVWQHLLPQLSKENKKFIYGQLKTGARAKDFEAAINWLQNAGLVYKICRSTKPGFPLKAYLELDVFKLFLLDTGLLCAMGDLPETVLLSKSTVLSEFKGALTEQFVLQSLVETGLENIAYWSSENVAEIDFIIQYESEIVPVEVKAEENLQAKSLKSYIEKHQPTLAVRTSMSAYREEEKFKNIPLYGLVYELGNKHPQSIANT